MATMAGRGKPGGHRGSEAGSWRAWQSLTFKMTGSFWADEWWDCLNLKGLR